MAFPTRSLAALLLAVSAVSCTDLTGHKRAPSAARIAFSPTFSREFDGLSASLAEFGLTFSQVHVQIRQVNDTTRIVADTTIPFTPESETRSLDLTVPVDEEHEAFNAMIEYTGPSALFRGSGIVESYDPSQPPSELPTIEVQYVGPGASVIVMTSSPEAVTVFGSSSTTVSFWAYDAMQRQVPLPPLVFTSSNTDIATVTAQGAQAVVHTTGALGSATITATSPNGVTLNVPVNVTPEPSYIYVVSGQDQTGEISKPLPEPLVVRVLGPQEQALPGITVTFAGPTGGSSSPAQVVTDSDGVARTTVTLGPTAGSQAVLATVSLNDPESAVSTTAYFTANEPGAVHFQAQSDTVAVFAFNSGLSETQYPAVRLLNGDASVANEAVKFTAAGACAFGDGATTISETTNADGFASASENYFFWTASNGPASCTVTVTAPNRQGVTPLVLRFLGTISESYLWVGGADNNWSNAANWWNADIPSSGTVFIPALTAFRPMAKADIGGKFTPLMLEAGAILDLGGHTLTTDPNSYIDGSTGGIITNGTVAMTGGEQTVNGIVPDFSCSSGVTGPSGDNTVLGVTGTMTLSGDCHLFISSAPVSVTGNLVTQNGLQNYALQMPYENSTLVVNGNITIGSNEASQQLNGGNIAVLGNFTVADAGRFWSTGTAVHLLGTKPTVHMSAQTESQFAKLYIDGASTVTFDNPVYVGDTLYMVVQSSLNIQTRLNAAGVDMADGSTIGVADAGTVTLGGPFTLSAGSTLNFAGAAALNVTADDKGTLLYLGSKAVVTINGASSLTSFVINGLSYDALLSQYPNGCSAVSDVTIQGSNTLAVTALKQYCHLTQ